MSGIDWLVLAVTLFTIVAYGIWKSRGTKNIEGYLLADKKVMALACVAITERPT